MYQRPQLSALLHIEVSHDFAPDTSREQSSVKGVETVVRCPSTRKCCHEVKAFPNVGRRGESPDLLSGYVVYLRVYGT